MKKLPLLLLALPLFTDARSAAPHFAKDAPRAQLLWSNGELSIDGARPPQLGELGLAVLRMRPTSPRRVFLPGKSRLLPLPSPYHLVIVPIDDMKELDRLALIAHDEAGLCGNLEFMAKDYRLASGIDFATPYFPARARFDALSSVVAGVSLAKIDEHIDRITSLSTRFHSSTVGKNASTTLMGLWTEITAPLNRWTLSEVTHSRTEQRSLVARLPGSDSEAPTLVLGAHLDSISRSSSDHEAAAPGADDDAAGIGILTEILRIIETQGLSFHRSIELHAYAAEEVGLIGSRDLASRYRQEGKKLAGMMQFDMAYFSQAGNEGKIHLLEDYSSRDLRRSAVEWIKTYLDAPYARGRLPSGSASDHKSWWEQGYATVFPFEHPVDYNHSIHSTDDTRANFDDGQLIQNMTRLGLLFTSYQAGLQSLDASYASQKENLLRPELSGALYLAIEPDDIGGSHFAVSAPSETSMLEFCPIDAASDAHCVAERLHLDRSNLSSARRVFYSEESLKLAAGQNWWVTAYDAADVLLAQRRITLEE